MKKRAHILTGIRYGLREVALLVSCLSLALLLPSCQWRPLIDVGPKEVTVRVTVNTHAIPNITTGIYNDRLPLPEVRPEVMHVLFFEGESDRLVTEAYISQQETDEQGNPVFKGTVMLDPDHYKLMIYNFGTETTHIDDYNAWSDATAYTLPASDRIAGAYYSATSRVEEKEPVVYDPDHLFLHVDANEVIPVHETTHVIHAEATTVIDTYYLQVKVNGLEHVSSANAFLSGMASGNVLSERRRITDPTQTVYFPLLKSDDKGVPVLCNVFNTFGHVPGGTNHLEITFDFVTVDGRAVRNTFDITDLFYTPEAIEKHWLLLEEVITVEPPKQPEGGGGGMAPSVSEWDDENHEIEL